MTASTWNRLWSNPLIRAVQWVVVVIAIVILGLEHKPGWAGREIQFSLTGGIGALGLFAIWLGFCQCERDNTRDIRIWWRHARPAFNIATVLVWLYWLDSMRTAGWWKTDFAIIPLPLRILLLLLIGVPLCALLYQYLRPVIRDFPPSPTITLSPPRPSLQQPPSTPSDSPSGALE
jgi:hypothetical protein